MYICIRNHGSVIGLGDTPEAAAAMADAIEAEQAERARKLEQAQKARTTPAVRRRLNWKTMRYEAVTE